MYLVLIINGILAQKSLDILGTSLYSLANLADISSGIQDCIPGYLYLIPGYLAQFTDNANLVRTLQNNFTEYNSAWDYCSVSKNLFENTIPVYESSENATVIRFLNMNDYLQLVIDTVREI